MRPAWRGTPLVCPVLVKRDRELAALERQLGLPQAGQGQVVLLPELRGTLPRSTPGALSEPDRRLLVRALVTFVVGCAICWPVSDAHCTVLSPRGSSESTLLHWRAVSPTSSSTGTPRWTGTGLWSTLAAPETVPAREAPRSAVEQYSRAIEGTARLGAAPPGDIVRGQMHELPLPDIVSLADPRTRKDR